MTTTRRNPYRRLTTASLVRRLAACGVRPVYRWQDGKRVQGFLRADIERALVRLGVKP